MRLASFFAGIGGFDLGFQHAGMIPAFHCEIDPYCQRILRRHWPEVPLHDDITTLKAQDIPEAEIWAGGWPCQDVSHANVQRKGIRGDRSGLFFTFAELARTVRPPWIVLENVPGLLSSDTGSAFSQSSTSSKRSGMWGSGSRVTLSARDFPKPRKSVHCRLLSIGTSPSVLS